MLRKILLSALVASTTLSCSDQTTLYIDEQQANIFQDNNAINLKGSVSFENSGVLDITLDQTITGKQAAKLGDEPAGNYPMTLIAQVSPPIYAGVTNLTASHVSIDGNFAFVSYNVAGEDYFGGIDVIDVSDPTDPRVTSRVVYLNADINSLQFANGYVYAVGGMDATASFTALSNSFITKIPVFNGIMATEAGVIYGYQPGDNATDVHIEGNEAFVTSGKNGTITIYDTKDLTVKKESAFTDLRSLAFDNNKVALLDASLGIRVLDNNLNAKKEIAINSDFGNYTKRSIDFIGDKIVVAEGPKGAGVYSYASGSLLQYIPILIDPNKAPTGDMVTNAVAINNDMVMMANGGAGLSISDDQGNTTKPYGVIQLDGSINYVQTRGDYAFAASGQQGLQIIKLNRLSLSLASQCSSLVEYTGISKLVVNAGEDVAFSGSKSFSSISVDGSLLMCGTWTVSNDVNIKNDASMSMRGTLDVGSNRRSKKIQVEQGATLRIEGNVTIYGDLVLKDGAILEFIGEDSIINIFGRVDMGNDVSILGVFRDVQLKL
ncbi:MAG: hypothetical protein MUO53_10470 [Maribacter sp.]|nr:hypothetical protein [Maribacter sp.]